VRDAGDAGDVGDGRRNNGKPKTGPPRGGTRKREDRFTHPGCRSARRRRSSPDSDSQEHREQRAQRCLACAVHWHDGKIGWRQAPGEGASAGGTQEAGGDRLAATRLASASPIAISRTSAQRACRWLRACGGCFGYEGLVHEETTGMASRRCPCPSSQIQCALTWGWMG
jgi:hypothetical protein